MRDGGGGGGGGDVYGCVDAEYDIEKELSGSEWREKPRDLAADECI